MGYDPRVAMMIHDRDFTVYYTDRNGNTKTAEGKLISTDHDGFVVLRNSNGKTELIPRDRIDSIVEREG